MTVLVALDNESLIAGLKAQGQEVLAVEDPELIVGELREGLEYVVVGSSLPAAHEVAIRVRLECDGPDRDRTPIIAVGPPPEELEALGIRCLADAHLGPQACATEVIEAAREVMLRRARQRRLFDQELAISVRTTPENVERTGEFLDRAWEVAGYDEMDQAQLAHTFREALGNAAEHGNKNDPDRHIGVSYFRAADRVTVVIADEGPGFDTAAFLARADEVSALEHTRSRRETEARPGGLGVFIMKKTCDQIAFNRKGNAIYLMKYLPGHKPGE